VHALLPSSLPPLCPPQAAAEPALCSLDDMGVVPHVPAGAGAAAAGIPAAKAATRSSCRNTAPSASSCLRQQTHLGRHSLHLYHL
jgi:hypothetical protein